MSNDTLLIKKMGESWTTGSSDFRIEESRMFLASAQFFIALLLAALGQSRLARGRRQYVCHTPPFSHLLSSSHW